MVVLVQDVMIAMFSVVVVVTVMVGDGRRHCRGARGIVDVYAHVHTPVGSKCRLRMGATVGSEWRFRAGLPSREQSFSMTLARCRCRVAAVASLSSSAAHENSVELSELG